jgi:hypothetical protein
MPMNKAKLLLLIAGFLQSFCFAQLKSPADFLGYPLGSKYTPHYKIVDYFRHVAAAIPSMVQLTEYGKTNEGRPLLLSFISSANNIRDLETVRKNNLGLTGLLPGGSSQVPAIVWLSYNVHGNETSSSEAAMMTLYELVGPSPRTKSWLENTVVIIDPCLNPDGRDRYVNWFSSVSGSKPNPLVEAREHNEPWPGGRTNHYYFDLNRDWAWQVQVESQQRIAKYNEWMPHVHVDFHEQYIDNPYYFAPAAQPYHEVITPWQRDFQSSIGRNHARYFDEMGWLYFTKEYFDLLYPSYGDTYPIYNGSIGMTYEQAGHSISGTSVITDIGDTLTLADRIMHHFTTGISTIETSSKNAGKLVSEFRNYFSNAVKNGVGEYKSYIIKYADEDEDRVKKLTELLDKNAIQYGKAAQINSRGLNYQTGKEEAFNTGEKNILVSSNQPKGALVKVLFEPNTLVVDSNTYDITAWSLPYAYGLNAYATKQPIGMAGPGWQRKTQDILNSDPSYGYIVQWNGVSAAKFVSALLQEGIRLRFSESPFELAGKNFGRGSVIIVKTSNQHIPRLWETVRKHALAAGVNLTAATTGFVDKGADFGSSKVRALKMRKVAVVTGKGTSANASGELWHFFDKEIDYPVTMVNLDDFTSLNWSKYDVIILPNGNYRFLNEKATADKLKDWVSEGGQLIALENAVSQLAKTDWAIKSKKAEESKDTSVYAPLRRYEDRERDFIPNNIPGSIFRIELDNTHPLAFGYPSYYYTLKMDDQIYEFFKEGGWNVGVLKKDRQVAGFVGSKLKSKMQDGLLFGTQNIGNGRIIYLADNPLFRGFWENGKLMLSNAIFLVGQ